MEKISNLLNTKFDSEPYYGKYDEYKNAKLKIIKDELCINFYGKGVPKKTSIQVLFIDNVGLC